jgi:hypothetical protein
MTKVFIAFLMATLALTETVELENSDSLCEEDYGLPGDLKLLVGKGEGVATFI